MAITAVTVAPGPARLAELHARSLPQKDNLCGCFWAALVLQAAGVEEVGGEPLDEDLVASRAGTLLPEGDARDFVPRGAESRADYRLALPPAPPGVASGTSAPALARTIEELSEGELAVVPVAGSWSPEQVLGLIAATAEAAPAATLVVNLRSGRLWGSRPPAATLLAHLAGVRVDPPAPEWDVGHFVTAPATVLGRSGSLVVVRDTYPSLGWGGYHLQPPEALAAGLERGDGREGGVLCVARVDEAERLRGRLAGEGFELRHWNNGTPDPGKER
jgi:hypothetical protein